MSPITLAVIGLVGLLNAFFGTYVGYLGPRWWVGPGKVWFMFVALFFGPFLVFAQEKYHFHATVIDIEASLTFLIAGYAGGRIFRRQRRHVPILLDAMHHAKFGDLSRARALLEKALAFDLPDLQRAESLAAISSLYHSEANFEAARESAREAITILDRAGNHDGTKLRADLENMLGQLTTSNGGNTSDDAERALNLERGAEKIFAKVSDPDGTTLADFEKILRGSTVSNGDNASGEAERLLDLDRNASQAMLGNNFLEACRIYKEILNYDLARIDRIKSLGNLCNAARQAGRRAEAVNAGKEALKLLGSGPPWETNEEAAIHGKISGLLMQSGHWNAGDHISALAIITSLVYGGTIGEVIGGGSVLVIVLFAIIGILLLPMLFLLSSRMLAVWFVWDRAMLDDYDQIVDKCAALILLGITGVAAVGWVIGYLK